MPFNLPGVLIPLHLLVNPRLVIPSVIIKDIRQLDFPELRRAGYRGAVFDKDNCLTLPHRDALVPELKDAWRECREIFGENNVLIVSNSAGSRLDAGEIQAESVTFHLSVPVLRHPSFKPSYSCIGSIRAYFASLPKPILDEELIIVGDRLLTDIVMANRMARRRSPSHGRSLRDEKSESTIRNASDALALEKIGPLAVWTSGVWERESMPIRWLEQSILKGVENWVVRGQGLPYEANAERFVRRVPEMVVVPQRMSLWNRWRK
ncbi:hypothetical protein IEO21_09312 [Rhodonia placenta]|uniref:HAD phosphatase n=1 Tax=Rhodonia placenta TaxID=104341 RepID=A0A8H7NUQ2_9APHY|nr:hypothetical protein IEO21_09312 [Postia placenta]